MPFALGTAHDDGGVRDESAIDGNVVRTRAAHAQNAPGIEHLNSVTFDRQWKMQNGRPTLGIVPHGAGHEYVANWNTAGEDLARGDTPAAIDAFRRARSRDPVRAP